MRRSVAAAALAWLILLAGCSADPDDPDPGPSPDAPPAAQTVTSAPADEVTVFADGPADELAVEVSRALFDQAPVVVLAGEGDPDDWEGAAERAAALGVPVLLTPAAGADPTAGPTVEATGEAGDPADGPAAELRRLATGTVVTYGSGAADWAARLTGVEAVPQSEPDPTVEPPEPLAGVAVLSPDVDETDADQTWAATATARAAGARVLVTGATDPRADPDLIAALAEQPPDQTLALGEAFGPPELLRDRLAVAATGVQLPGGGQLVYPGRRIVALYGHPGDPGLGVLGEQSMDETLDRARAVAAEYEDLVDEPVVPALEIITTIASAAAGPAGDYSRRTPVPQLREWVDAAGEAGIYVVLDLQPGHTDFLTQAKEYEELLREPHVGLALDPEWRLADDERHMVNIGSVDASEVNQVVDWLAGLTAEHRLPQKLLIVHQFQLRMISDRGEIDTGRDEVAVLIHADGFGTPSQKRATWDALRAEPLPGAWWGWKNFYDEDRPTFTPAETTEVDPSPVFVSYQ